MIAVHNIYDIPLQAPQTETTVDSQVVSNTFNGFCSHFHARSSKIDCANIDMKELINSLKDWK